MGSGYSYDVTHYDVSSKEVVGEEVPSVCATIDQKRKECKDQLKRFKAEGLTVDDTVHFESCTFHVVLKGNAEKTRALIEKRFANDVEMTCTKRQTGFYRGGTSHRDEYVDVWMSDCLECKKNISLEFYIYRHSTFRVDGTMVLYMIDAVTRAHTIKTRLYICAPAAFCTQTHVYSSNGNATHTTRVIALLKPRFQTFGVIPVATRRSYVVALFITANAARIIFVRRCVQ